MVRERCTANKVNGEPCGAFALPGECVCWSHSPGNQDAVKAAQRRGGENRSAARRAAKAWASAGRAIRPHELPDLLRGCMLRVATGAMEPSAASAIAGLAKASLQVSHDLELEQRLAALEAIVADPARDPKIRRIG